MDSPRDKERRVDDGENRSASLGVWGVNGERRDLSALRIG